MNTPAPNKYLIVYHANCIDGITAAAVVYKYLIEVEKVDTDNIYSLAARYDTGFEDTRNTVADYKIDILYIVDFSFTKTELFILDDEVNCIYLYDHHKTAFENLCGVDYEVREDSREVFLLSSAVPNNVNIILDNNESGASLVWRELFDRKLPHLVGYVKDYDLYCFKHERTKAINKYLKGQDKTVANFLRLLICFELQGYITAARTTGEIIINYEESLEASLISDGVTSITINGTTGLVVNAPTILASSVGHKLALRSHSFGATWCQLSDGVVQFSLRSNGDECDVSELAGSMGGGGHKNAASFTMNSPLYDDNDGITIWGGEV